MKILGLRLCLAFILILCLGIPVISAGADGLEPGPPVQPMVSKRTTSSIDLVWKAPKVNQKSVTDYEIKIIDYQFDWPEWPKKEFIFQDGVSTATHATIIGLRAEDYYRFEVRSIGSSGKSPWVPVGQTSINQISASDVYTCGQDPNGKVKCWGTMGGLWMSDSLLARQLGLFLVDVVTASTQISAGDDHACARLQNGHISCWGYNNRGQLGNGMVTAWKDEPDDMKRKKPVLVSGIKNATQVSAGDGFSCARLKNSQIACWGDNSYGQLGFGDSISVSYPRVVKGIKAATQVTTGRSHACARLSNGQVQCWGDGERGQLGNGSKKTQLTPVLVKGIHNATQVSAGENHTCATLDNGAVKCWGAGAKLGDGTNVSRNTPVTVKRVTNATQVDSGKVYTCARLSNGQVKCWGGYNDQDLQLTPELVTGISNATQVSVGLSHLCARLSNGQVQCWGRNVWYQISIGLEDCYYFDSSCDSTYPQTVDLTPRFTLAHKPEPVKFRIESRTVNSLRIGWEDPFSDGFKVDKYMVQWSPNGTKWKTKFLSARSILLSGLTPSTMYTIKVSAHSQIGWSTVTIRRLGV